MDGKEFEILFKEQFTALTMFAMKYVGDLDTSKEIVHNVFLNLWERRNKLDSSKSLKSYLFTAVYNRSLNHLRDQKKFLNDELAAIGLRYMEYQGPEQQLEASELEKQIQEALAALPGRCREVFLLNRFEGLRYQEIAERLGISVKTVEAQISKALRILRDQLKDHFSWFLILLTTLMQ